MPEYQQTFHEIRIDTPLGPDAVVLMGLTGSEEFSGLFRYQLDLLSQDDNIKAKDIVGKNVTITVQFPDDTLRYYNAYVVRFANKGTMDRGTVYWAEIVPWLWFLTKTQDCRIFQNKTVPQIVQKIFDDLGMTDYELKLNGKHTPWEYCVQYRESDYNFVSRLLEQEGIFGYFRHENGKHTLVLGDHAGAYMDALGKDKKVRYTTERAGDVLNDNVLSWEHKFEFRTGKWMLTDYDFKKPNNTRNPTYEILKVQTNTVLDIENANKFEVYEYAGEYDDKSDGEELVKARMEAEEAGFEIVEGTSYCRSFGPGVKFTVEKHRQKSEEGKQYVVTSVSHECKVGSFYPGGKSSDNFYVNKFTCVPASAVVRPQRKTPKPKMYGVQTATVTGPAGEEIYTDEFGRVKVQFHWDREGKMDENSSCWMRCATPSAGRNWGFMVIPRIGQEVVVTFLEGDPDQPLITGCVYNPGQMPSRSLPDDKTKWGFKGNSSPGGSGHNEITMQDKKGQEQIYIHGEKDVDIRCKNNYHQIVGYDKSDGSMRTYIHNHQHTMITGNREEKIQGDRKMAIQGSDHLKIDGDQKEKIGGAKHLNVAGDFNIKTGTLSVDTGKLQEKIGGNWGAEAGQEIHLKGGMNVVIEAGLSLTIKAGGGFINIGPTGVAIQGTTVLINSGGAAGSGSGAIPTAPADPDTAAPVEPKMDGYSQTGGKSCP